MQCMLSAVFDVKTLPQYTIISNDYTGSIWGLINVSYQQITDASSCICALCSHAYIQIRVKDYSDLFPLSTHHTDEMRSIRIDNITSTQSQVQ